MFSKFLIAICAFGVVRSDKDYISSLSELEFGGDGSKTCDDDGNCASKFSSGYRSDICSVTEYKRESNCWGIQGISEYDDFITRALYEQEADSDSFDGAGQYIATSVILKTSTSGDIEYSNILILPPNGRGCHAGDMVLTKHNDMFYFLFACTSWILVFNETAIVHYPNGHSVNGKKFYYRVYPEDAIEISDKGIIDDTAYDLSLSFISRNQGTDDQFWTGRFSEDDSNPKINLVTFDFDSMSIIAVDPYTVDSAFTFKRVQGITRIGDNMLITHDPDYDLSGKSSKLTLCPVSTDVATRVVSGTGCVTKCTVDTPLVEFRVLQGSEVSSDGTVYVGSEFGSPRGIWYEFGDFDSLPHTETVLGMSLVVDGCSSWDAAPPLPDVDAPILPRQRPYYASNYAPKDPSDEPWVFEVVIYVLIICVGVLMGAVVCLTVSAWRRVSVRKTDSWPEQIRV